MKTQPSLVHYDLVHQLGNEFSALASEDLCFVPDNCYYIHTEQLVVSIITMMIHKCNLTDPVMAQNVRIMFDDGFNDGLCSHSS